MNRQQKNQYASVLKDKWSRSKIALFADYRGLTAQKADDLRKQLRAQKVEVKVLKNSMARFITRDGSLGKGPQQLMENLVGPTLVAFSYDDSVVIAQLMSQFAQANEAFQLKESLIGEACISVNEIDVLAKLPGRPVLLAQLLSTMNAPLANLMGVFQAVPRSLLTVLVAIEKKKANS